MQSFLEEDEKTKDSNEKPPPQPSKENPEEMYEMEVTDDCSKCDQLKSLVFQAKEAIDDLKMEIDEWKEIYA